MHRPGGYFFIKTTKYLITKTWAELGRGASSTITSLGSCPEGQSGKNIIAQISHKRLRFFLTIQPE